MVEWRALSDIEDMELEWDVAPSHARTLASLAHTMPCMLPSMRGTVETKICLQGGPFANLQAAIKAKLLPIHTNCETDLQ